MPNQTGPRTPQGKQASSQNNRQHGFSTSNIIVHPDDQPFFDEIEAELRNEVQPDGPLEIHAFQRLVTAAWQIEQCRKQEGSLVRQEPTDQNKANLEKVHRYYLRWEGSYNSAFRQLRLLQTDRGCIAYNNRKIPDTLAPLADLPKIEQFARRIANQYTLDDHVRKGLSNQLAIMQMEEQIRKAGRTPQSAPDAPVQPPSPTKSTLCETKYPHVGRNALCPCGSGKKHKRCCGTDVAPILNNAA